jgi:copper homeostasis protein
VNVKADRPLIEVCVGSVNDAFLAEQAGAGRVELCSALELGGLTPSIGTVRECVETIKIPIVAMIRPRAGGFCYDPSEFNSMLRDIDAVLECGVDGVVFGSLTGTGEIDRVRVASLVRQAQGSTTVFHRAFDFLRRPDLGLQQLIDLGVNRILTSGSCETAMLGADNIRRHVEDAEGRIEILPGGGIRPENIDELLQRTRCTQAHVGASIVVLDDSLQGNDILLADPRCLASNRHRCIDPTKIPR